MCSFNDVWDSFDGAASEVTHSVCEYGNGSMAEGMRKIVYVAHESGFLNGRKEGVVLGVGGSAVIALAAWGVTKVVCYCKKKQKVKNAIEIREKNIEIQLRNVQREIDDFHATHLQELTDEENKVLLDLLAKKLKILKEKSNFQYQKLYSVVV